MGSDRNALSLLVERQNVEAVGLEDSLAFSYRTGTTVITHEPLVTLVGWHLP